LVGFSDRGRGLDTHVTVAHRALRLEVIFRSILPTTLCERFEADAAESYVCGMTKSFPRLFEGFYL
jgi:hypothetical protein